MSTRKYVLDGHTPKQELDLITWAKWYETSNLARTVAYTPKSPPGGNISGNVLTMFLSIEPLGPPRDPPRLFETYVMDGPWNHWTQRVTTWEEAEALHAKVLAALKAGLPEGQFV